MKILWNIIHIWYNEQVNIFHDKGILIFILFVPLAYPMLYSYVYTNEVVRDVPAAAVDENHSAYSREFLRRIDASADVSIVAHCASMADAKELIKQQKVYGIVRVPSTFDLDLSRGDQTTVGLYCDMCSMLYYKALLLTTTNVSLEMNRNIKTSRYVLGTTEQQDKIDRMPIDYSYVPLYNPQSGFASFLIPPVLMLIIQQTLFLGIGMSIGNSREKFCGHVIPVRHWYKDPVQIVIGKTMPYFMVYIIMAIYMFSIVNHCFALPQLAHYLTFLSFIVPYLLACIFMAMTLSALIYRREDFIMLFVFLSVPLLFLSGISWPIPAMPRFWHYFSWIFPSTFGMQGYVGINSMGASLHDIAFQYYGLWIQALVYFLLSCLFFRIEIKKLLVRNHK